MWVQKKDRGLKEQFFNGISNDNMIQIMRVLTAVLNNEIASKHLLTWSRKVKAQEAKK